MGEICLVTGATGFVGSNVINALLSRGKQVRALVLPGDPAASRLPEGVEVVAGDVLQPDSMAPLFDVPQGTDITVIHCVGIISMSWQVEDMVRRVNVTGTHHVVDWCLKAGVKRLVYVSTVHAIEEKPHGQVMTEPDFFDPDRMVGGYAKTKAEATALVMDAVHQQGLRASVVFPSGICGPGDIAGGFLTQMFIDYAAGRIPAGVKGGYSFVDVRDVADAIATCAEKGADGQGYILAGHYATIREMFSILHEDCGMKRTRLYVPLWVAKLGLPLFSLYYRQKKQKPVFTSYSLTTLASNGLFSSARAREELGFSPRPLRDTFIDTTAWLRKEGKIVVSQACIDKPLRL
ncbi:MAG: NAD-dependent epimerase/dehydratase family protein [Clostridiales bacterium]|nr:NAD-dependent epimerase/dehydratase family protein [Clostridiales bacterium]